VRHAIKNCLFSENEKLIVHGHSLGGAVAANLNFPELSLVLCDRTFSSLYEASLYMVGPKLTMLYKFFTLNRWPMKTVESFLNLKCHKIISCDYADTIIYENASLK